MPTSAVPDGFHHAISLDLAKEVFRVHGIDGKLGRRATNEIGITRNAASGISLAGTLDNQAILPESTVAT